MILMQRNKDNVRKLGTSITSSNQNPRCFAWRNRVATWHWEIDILGKVFEVIDSLLNCVKAKALNAQIWQGVAKTIESMLKNNGGAILLLRYRIEHLRKRLIGMLLLTD